MKVECLGGCREVGRSAFVLDTGEERILLDYGSKVETGEIPLKAKNIDGMLLSHTHLDHVGAAPLLKDVDIYATAATFDQANLLLEDAIKVAKKKNMPVRYSKRDIRKMKRIIVTYGQQFEIGNSVIDVFDAGHVPGSAGFLIENDKRVFYTGDFKISETRLLKGARFDVKDIDLLITESTYAYKEHPPREAVEKKLIDIIEETIARDGNVLIPAFAIGRAAEILLVLHSYKIKYPIYLDGMAKEATEIIMRYPELLKDPKALKKILERVVPLYTAQDRKMALKGPSIIVTTAGMLSGGPVLFFLKKLRNREDSSLVFTGFQVPGTPGRTLLETGIFENENVSYKVKMQIKYLDFSAHASRSELLEFIEKTNPEKIMVVHGDSCEEFSMELERRGFEAFAPKIGDVIEI